MGEFPSLRGPTSPPVFRWFTRGLGFIRTGGTLRGLTEKQMAGPGPQVQREGGPGRAGARLATAAASSAGVTGLETWIWKPARSASTRSCGLA